MAELAKTKFFTKTGAVTATVLDTVGPDRMLLHVIKGAHSAQLVREKDATSEISRPIKDLLVFPFTT